MITTSKAVISSLCETRLRGFLDKGGIFQFRRSIKLRIAAVLLAPLWHSCIYTECRKILLQEDNSVVFGG